MEQVYWLLNLLFSLETRIFFNRHIDQVILCSFYGISNVSSTCNWNRLRWSDKWTWHFRRLFLTTRSNLSGNLGVFRDVFVDSSSTKWYGGHPLDHHHFGGFLICLLRKYLWHIMSIFHYFALPRWRLSVHTMQKVSMIVLVKVLTHINAHQKIWQLLIIHEQACLGK
jgi:hypothetical protein